MTVGIQSEPAPGVREAPQFRYGSHFPWRWHQRDERTQRQRCWDNETARAGGTLTELDRQSIELKCSQR